MKSIFAIVFAFLLVVSCSKKHKEPLINRVESFNISECQKDCGIDSIGIKQNEVLKNQLKLRFGYIVNCSWKSNGYLKDLILQNDTLVVKLHQKPEVRRTIIDTLRVDSLRTEIQEIEQQEFPIYDCNCFLNFDLEVNRFHKKPRTVRVFSILDSTYWDTLPKARFEIIETEIEI